MGKHIESQTIQKTLGGYSIPSIPKVRTTDGHLMDWDRNTIIKQLLKETKLCEEFHGKRAITEEEAKEIAKETEKRIKDMGVKFLSGPLVRELVNIILLEHGHTEWRNISTRVGTPVYDAHRIDMGTGFEAKDNANLQENAETSHKKKADKMSKEQYLLMIPPKLADAHLNGDIHIHDLEYFGTRAFCQDWDLRYFFYYGLMPDGSGTKASVAGPAKKSEVAILHAVKALGSAQTNFSVAGDEDILIKGGFDDLGSANTHLIKIGEFVDRLMAGKKTSPIPQINGEFLDITDLDVKAAAFNPDTLKIEYKAINRIIRHPAHGMLHKITTQSGRVVSVTGAHSVFILDDGAVKPVEVSRLKSGDYMVIPKKLPVEAVDEDINIIQSLIKLPDELISDVYVIGASEKVAQECEIKYDWKRRDRVPLLFIKHNCINIEANFTYLGMSRSPHTIPSIIKISALPALSRLLGYFAAEGHITFDADKNVYSVVLSFGSHETEIIDDAKSCIREVFGTDVSIRKPHPSEVQLLINNKLISILFRDVFCTGMNSKDKRIPPVIFNISEENKLEFLAGYYCDASVHRREIIYKTVTKKLASDLLYLLLQMGIVGKQKRDEGKEHPIGDSIIKSSISMDDFEYSSTNLTTTNSPVAVPLNHAGIKKIVESVNPIRNIPELAAIHKNRIKWIEKIADSDLGFDIVESIQLVKPATDYVYDLSIDGYENFIGGHGAVVLHNSGGQGFYNFLTFIAPYFEGMSYDEIEQLMQMFVYEMTQMMVARGGQLVFSSVQLSPGVPRLWKDKPVVYKGGIYDGANKPVRTYGEFEREVRLAFEALMNVMLKGDYWGKPFNFPKPEISIEPDFMVEDEEFNSKHPELLSYGELYTKAFELAAKYGAPYFDNQQPEYRGAGKGISCYQCLAGDELIPVAKSDGKIHVASIEKLFEDASKHGISTDSNGVEFAEFDGSTPSVNFETLMSSLRTFKGVMRKKYSGKMLNIILNSGRRIRVTPDHPVFVLENGTFVKKQAGELEVGEYMPVLKNSNFNAQPLKSININKMLIDAGYASDIVVLDREVNIRNAKKRGLPKEIAITSDMIRFLGYYLVEGCRDHCGRRYSVRLSFGNHETELIEDAVRCIRSIGFEPIISIEKTATNICINSKLLYLLIDALGCGHNAHSKSVPDVLFNAETSLVGHYISCAFEGDGNINHQVVEQSGYAHNAHNIRMRLVSRNAIQKLIFLAQRAGIQMNYMVRNETVKHPHTGSAVSSSNMDRGGTFTRIPIKKTGLRYSNLKYPSQYRSGDYDCVNQKLIDTVEEHIERFIKGDILPLKIKRIEEEDYEGYVYDLVDVSNTHNFSNALGVVTGNCCAYNFSSSHDKDSDFEDKLYFRNGKHFSMGAWQVVSINCPRAAYMANKNDEALFSELKKMMDMCIELFKVKRRWMEIVIQNNRMPFATQRPKDPVTMQHGEIAVDTKGLVYTIGVVGINEMVQHHTGKQVHESEDARRLAIRAMFEMKFYAKELSQKHGMEIALARTPAETTAQRFAVSDLLHKEYRQCAEPIIKGNVPEALAHIHETRDLPVYYTNGTHIPPNADVSLPQRIKLEEVFFPIVDGGNIMHIWLGEAAPDPQGLKELAMKIAKETQVGYFAFTKDMTVCMDDFHVASGLLDACPNCASENVEHLSRVTGYIQAVSGWNEGKKQELRDRKRYGVGGG